MTSCEKCNAPLAESKEIDPNATLASDEDITRAETVPDTGDETLADPDLEPRAAAGAGGGVVIGSVLAGRYRILKKVGQGGMGAVYIADDREIGRRVALKVIREDLAGNPKILERFKQEMLLSRQISHRNVIRIFDMGVQGRIKFITMEYVEGRDLSDILAERRLAPQESVHVARQILLALEAAHGEGVVHRDLKPQNVMVNSEWRAWVMDFGLARTVDVESGGMTQAGQILGTPTYMSPEQARGDRADQRSDLFAFGIVFYELLTGTVPYRAESVLASLLMRTQKAPAPPITENPELPDGLNQIVVKCLIVDKEQRYQTAKDILVDLDFVAASLNWDRNFSTLTLSTVTLAVGMQAPGSIVLPSMMLSPAAGTAAPATPAPVEVVPPAPRSRRNLIMGGAAAVAVGGAGWFLKDRFVSGGPSDTVKPVTLLVADFLNETGDPVFDGALEPTFTFALEGAGFVSTYNRSAARTLVQQMQAGGGTRLTEEAARVVAVREGISVVVGGIVRRSGNSYTLTVRTTDAVTGTLLMSEDSASGSRDKILGVTGKLAASVRKALGDTTPESLQLAAAETFTAASVEAAQMYSHAQENRFAGKAEEAIKLYQEAIRLDPNLGTAYYSLGVAYSNLGQRGEAEKYYKIALTHIDRMSVREKYRTRGAYYLTALNHEKALEEFRQLVQLFPVDTAALSNLAYVEYLRRDMRKALENGKRALDVYPKNALLRSNYAMYAMYSGDFTLAEKEAGAVTQANPGYLKAYNTLALSRIARNEPAKAAEAYTQVQRLSVRGASFAAMGLADLALYQGLSADAVALLEKAIAVDLEAKNEAGAAKKTAVMASALMLLGRSGAAVAAADRAASLRKEESVLYEASRVFLDAGQPAKASAIARQLSERLETDPQIYARLIEGEVLLKKGDARSALRSFREAQKQSDTWLGRLSLGRAYLAASNFAEANSEFDLCKARKGEAVELFLDEMQTVRYFPQIEYYIARTRQGLKSPGAAESYNAFLSMKHKDAQDPMVHDARARLTKP